jgi:hypothetical protein
MDFGTALVTPVPGGTSFEAMLFNTHLRAAHFYR